MKAIQIMRTGGPEVLAYVELPTPVPGPNDVLVKAHAIGVNMPEVLVRRGTYAWMPPLPAIPGIEMSGVVVATGADVRALRVGQPVYVSARELVHRGGCYAPAGQRHDQPADSGTGAARRGTARPDAPRERPGAGKARPQTLNAGMTSFAKRRSVSIPPVLLSRTYSAPRSRSAWSLTAISSGVP